MMNPLQWFSLLFLNRFNIILSFFFFFLVWGEAGSVPVPVGHLQRDSCPQQLNWHAFLHGVEMPSSCVGLWLQQPVRRAGPGQRTASRIAFSERDGIEPNPTGFHRDPSLEPKSLSAAFCTPSMILLKLQTVSALMNKVTKAKRTGKEQHCSMQKYTMCEGARLPRASSNLVPQMNEWLSHHRNRQRLTVQEGWKISWNN